MKFRTFITSIFIAGFLSGIPTMVHAKKPPGWGDYDEHHEWHHSGWWLEHHPNWVRTHHPEWALNGDWDKHHHWHDRDWWKAHHAQWSHEHHPDWF